jgi:hypothetical protein
MRGGRALGFAAGVEGIERDAMLIEAVLKCPYARESGKSWEMWTNLLTKKQT